MAGVRGTGEEKGRDLATVMNWSFCPNQKGQRVGRPGERTGECLVLWGHRENRGGDELIEGVNCDNWEKESWSGEEDERMRRGGREGGKESGEGRRDGGRKQCSPRRGVGPGSGDTGL